LIQRQLFQSNHDGLISKAMPAIEPEKCLVIGNLRLGKNKFLRHTGI